MCRQRCFFVWGRRGLSIEHEVPWRFDILDGQMRIVRQNVAVGIADIPSGGCSTPRAIRRPGERIRIQMFLAGQPHRDNGSPQAVPSDTKNDGIVQLIAGRLKLDFSANFPLFLQQHSRHIARNLDRLGDGAPLRHEPLNVFRSRQIHALRKLFDLYALYPLLNSPPSSAPR